MTSMVDQKRAFNKLKHDLEPWRNLLVQLDSILKWEKNYYPAAIFGVISVLYLLLWELNLSTITLLALLGLIALAFDYGYPTLARLIYKSEQWTGQQEANFENICQQLTTIKLNLNTCYEYLFNTQERKSTLVVIIIGLALLVLAWVGAAFDNFFLMYFLTLSLALLPGIMQKSVVTTFRDKLCATLNAQMQQVRQRVGGGGGGAAGNHARSD